MRTSTGTSCAARTDVETLRILVSIPLMVGDAIWTALTRDSEEEAIREQQARFAAWANDQ